MNYDRPHFKHIDNLTRIRNEVSSWYGHDKENKSSKKSNTNSIQFSDGEWEVCKELLTSLETYYTKPAEYLERLNLSKIKKYEEALRKSIRKFLLASMIATLKKEENSGLLKFYALLEKNLPKEDLLFEMFSQETEAIGDEFEKQSNAADQAD